MRTAVLAATVTLALSASVFAQGTAPSPADPGQPPAAAPSPDAGPPAQRGRRGGRRAAEGQPPAACDQGSAAEVQKCKAANVKSVQQALNRKIAQTCNKAIAAGGGRGRGAADERLACRYDTLNQLLQSLN